MCSLKTFILRRILTYFVLAIENSLHRLSRFLSSCVGKVEEGARYSGVEVGQPDYRAEYLG